MTALAPASHAWRLGDLLEGVAAPGACAQRWAECQVSGLATDAHLVTPGTLFFAVPEALAQGLSSVEDASSRGACAILAEPTIDWPIERLAELGGRLGLPVVPVAHLRSCLAQVADRFFGAPSSCMDVLGIAGAQGRGRLAHLLAQALNQESSCGVVTPTARGLITQLQALEAPLDALGLHSSLAQFLDLGARAAVVTLPPIASLGSPELAAVRLTHLVVTQGMPGLAREDRSASISSALEAMARRNALEWVVVNLDDPRQRELLDGLALGLRVAAYSLTPDTPWPDRCDLFLRASTVETNARGLRMRVERNASEVAESPAVVEVGLIGRSNAANLLAVLAVLCSRGIPLRRAASLLGAVHGVPGRMECFGGDGAPLIVVDSARSPERLEQTLGELRSHPFRRLITVLGCDRDRDPAERPLLGTVAEASSDIVILTDDNPRGPFGDAIIADILSGMSRTEQARVARERGLAIRTAIALAGVGDAVLVAGKGEETIQDMGDLKVHFSDRAQVVEALREWREGRH